MGRFSGSITDEVMKFESNVDECQTGSDVVDAYEA